MRRINCSSAWVTSAKWVEIGAKGAFFHFSTSPPLTRHQHHSQQSHLLSIVSTIFTFVRCGGSILGGWWTKRSFWQWFWIESGEWCEVLKMIIGHCDNLWASTDCGRFGCRRLLREGSEVGTRGEHFEKPPRPSLLQLLGSLLDLIQSNSERWNSKPWKGLRSNPARCRCQLWPLQIQLLLWPTLSPNYWLQKLTS